MPQPYSEILSFDGCDCCPGEVLGWVLDCPACGEETRGADSNISAFDFNADGCPWSEGPRELMKQARVLEIQCGHCPARYRAPITTYSPDELELERTDL